MELSFYQRHHPKSEAVYMENCLSSELKTDGFFMQQLLEHTASRFLDSHLLFMPSCTLALETSMACLNLQPGDEVILPSFNFPSAANAVLLRGGRPVLCDIDPDTQNISLNDAAAKITKRTRAIVAVHYGGVACPMDELSALAAQAGIALIEDAAQGMGASYRSRPLGSIGTMGAISFHHTKNITCGEGGLFLTGDEELAFYAGQYRLHGTNRTMYLRKEVDRYTWNTIGSCAALSEPGAAILTAQLEALGEITDRRVSILNRYHRQLKPLELWGKAKRMVIPEYASPNGHIFYLRFVNQKLCDQMKMSLSALGIDAKTHYVPLHISPMGKKLGYKEGDLPQSFSCYQTLLRLPIHTGLSDDDVDFICETLLHLCRIQ